MKKFILPFALTGALLAGAVGGAIQADAAESANANSVVTAVVTSGGITATATDEIAFGSVAIGVSPDAKDHTLTVKNLTGSAGWNATVSDTAPADQGVSIKLDGENVTTVARDYHKTTEITTEATPYTSDLKLELGSNVKTGAINRTLSFVVATNTI